MADVYLAKVAGKHDFAKLSVVKRLKLMEDEDPEILTMFADEARLSARLNHPGIVQTFEVGEDENGPFLVMEYIEGQPLGRIRSRSARRTQPLSRGMAIKIVRETIGALAYAHNLIDHDGSVLSVVHRDVSPENIMVTYTGLTKLVDFGVAKTTASISKTRAGVLKGKVAYMAPEQARSDENIDARVDVFAVGLILWELLTGKRLWEGMSEAKVFERLLDKDPLPRARSVDETIPQELDDICAKAISKEKEDRYESANDMLEALEEAAVKLGLRAADREIGQFVSKLFEVEREKVRSLVAAAMATKEDSNGATITNEDSDPLLLALPSISNIPKSDPTPSFASITTSEAPSGVASHNSSLPAQSTSVGVSETKVTEPEFKRANPAKIFFGIAALATTAIVAVMVGKNIGAKDAEMPIVIPPPPPSASAAPVPDVQVDIWVKPPNARLTIDGKPQSVVPFHSKAPKDATVHELKVEADGYETRTLKVAFDRDRAIDMTLNKVGAPPRVWTPGTAPPPPRPSASTSASATPAAPTATLSPEANTPPPSFDSTPAPSATGITEINPDKPKTPGKDKLDTDVFKR